MAVLSSGIALLGGRAQDVSREDETTMSAQAPGALQAQLRQINAQVPAPISDRIDAAIEGIGSSGTAPGLAVGDSAPGFTLPDQLGRPVSLQERLASGPVVLVFYRGAWCPLCNTHLRALQRALPEVKARGASLLAVGPQSPDRALSLVEKAGLGFDVLSDVDQQVIRAYRLQFTAPADLQDVIVNVFQTDLRAHTADGSWRLPVPATFVLDRTGAVRAAHVQVDFRTRMEPAAIVAALEEVTSCS
jgi:peroxiredoxin